MIRITFFTQLSLFVTVFLHKSAQWMRSENHISTYCEDFRFVRLEVGLGMEWWAFILKNLKKCHWLWILNVWTWAGYEWQAFILKHLKTVTGNFSKSALLFPKVVLLFSNVHENSENCLFSTVLNRDEEQSKKVKL